MYVKTKAFKSTGVKLYNDRSFRKTSNSFSPLVNGCYENINFYCVSKSPEDYHLLCSIASFLAYFITVGSKRFLSVVGIIFWKKRKTHRHQMTDSDPDVQSGMATQNLPFSRPSFTLRMMQFINMHDMFFVVQFGSLYFVC